MFSSLKQSYHNYRFFAQRKRVAESIFFQYFLVILDRGFDCYLFLFGLLKNNSLVLFKSFLSALYFLEGHNKYLLSYFVWFFAKILAN